MSKTPSKKSHDSGDELLAEYHFDYQKAKPNRFAGSDKKQFPKGDGGQTLH